MGPCARFAGRRDRTRRCQPIVPGSTCQDYLGRNFVLAAANVVSLKPALDGLLAAPKRLGKLVPGGLRELFHLCEHVLARYRALLAVHAICLKSRHVRILEAENVANVHRQEPAGFDDVFVAADRFTNQSLPVGECQIRLVFLAHVIWWRPEAQIHALRGQRWQQIAGIAHKYSVEHYARAPLESPLSATSAL